MPPRVIHGLAELESFLGKEIGVSDWTTVTQERVQQFADATGDHQWIHVDPERAKKDSPYGTTIAHGFFTLSLCPALAHTIFVVEGIEMAVNYGLDRVRFPNAVRVGSRIRMRTELIRFKPHERGATVRYKHTFEIEGEEKPPCVVEAIARLFDS